MYSINNRITRRAKLLLACLFSLLASFSTTATELSKSLQSIEVFGHNYKLELKENTKLIKNITAKGHTLKGKHYIGYLQNNPNNWVRFSVINNQVHGLASIAGELLNISSPAKTDHTNTAHLTAKHINASEEATCGTAHKHSKSALEKYIKPQQTNINSNITNHSALKLAQAAVPFADLCDSTIDDVCLLAELELIFDKQYQDNIGSDFVDQGVSLINMVEGYYLNSFGINFQTLSTEFPTDELFISSTNSNDYVADILDKRRNGTLDFLESSQSLVHVVTGRDFDGSTVGVAYIDVLCNSAGVGTSQIVNGSLATTALVIAHELGHNFSAGHDGDGDNTCASSGFIMAASVSRNVESFSSCSVDEMQSAIAAINNPAACFNFPVDARLEADAENIDEIAAEENFNLEYLVSTNETYQAISELSVQGSLTSGSAMINSATLDGQSCSVASDNQSYSCSVDSPQNASSLLVDLLGSEEGEVNITHNVSVENANDVLDIVTDNDQVVSTITILQAVIPPPSAASDVTLAQADDSTDVRITWSDNSNDETGFRVERQEDSGSFNNLVTLDANTVEYTDTTTEADVSYSYRVIAFNDSGDASASNTATITVEAVDTGSDGGNGGGGNGGGGNGDGGSGDDGNDDDSGSSGGGSTTYLFLLLISLCRISRCFKR